MAATSSPNPVIVATLILIISLSVTLSNGANPTSVKSVSFQDAISGTLYYKTASLSWISSRSFILEEENQLKEVEVATATEKVCIVCL